jgi:hypothetical protein
MATLTELQAAESKMRQLLADNDLPAPDEVEYRDGSVAFLWHETKTAVVIDVDEVPTDAQRATSTSIV